MNINQFLIQCPCVLLNRSRAKGLFNDFYKNDLTKVNLLMLAYDNGILGDIRDAYPCDDMLRNRLAKKLVQQYSIVDDKAVWAVDTWISFFSQQLISQLAQAEKDEDLNSDVVPVIETDSSVESPVDYGRALREDYYVNPSFTEKAGQVYIPCGIGNTDCGFTICGVNKQPICRNRYGDIFALVYNYLVRNSHITDQDIPVFIREIKSTYAIDYRSVYRTAIVLLQMIKNNYTLTDVLELFYVGEKEHLQYAQGLINHYAALFCRLMNVAPVQLRLNRKSTATKVSLNPCEGIYCESNDALYTNAREIWYGRKINYHLTRENLPDLEYILKEISPFDSFKEGQFDALKSMLSADRHAVCIMPTGSGKSLIYYLASLLQPLPLFVVSPTEILIEDQIRNLKKFHHIDNVAHLLLTDKNSFSTFEIRNSLNFLTPTTLQSRNLLMKFRGVNSGTHLNGMRTERIAPGPLASYIVLDEIHCLSNWGHDFRPEYLMLSKYLNQYLDQITFWGFTATANYTVVDDVQRQLDIPQGNFFAPISFEKFNVSYDFRCVNSDEEMFKTTGEIIQSLIDRNERTIVFAKGTEEAYKLADVIGFEADVFNSDDIASYHQFVDGKCKVLVSSEELGVGINLPDIKNVVHFGLPVSKSEYVQEIGRAGRANERVTSYVIYLNNSTENVPTELLSRDTPISDIPNLIKNLDNDYAKVYRRLTNGCPTKDALYDRLISLYMELQSAQRAFLVKKFAWKELEESKQKLYMLYSVGYIYDWYFYCQCNKGEGVEVLIDICSSESSIQDTLHRMKNRAREYFDFLGNARENIVKVSRATTPEEIIRTYVEWYYIKYLYHHNEQFLDLCEFFNNNTSRTNEEITNDIKDHFSLPFVKIKSDEAYFGEMSAREVVNKAIFGVGRDTLINVERINSNRYSYKFDLLLFFGNLRMNGSFNEDRFRRVLRNLPIEEKPWIMGAFKKIYPICNTAAKIEILKYIERNGHSIDMDCKQFITDVYSENPKDLVYYAVVAQMVNRHFAISGR